MEESAHCGEAGFTYFVSLCHFLEVLYDPYFTWRHFLRGSEADYSKLTFQPALLHVEVIPFIYGKYLKSQVVVVIPKPPFTIFVLDCFRTNLVDSYPHLGSELLHVLGAAVAGAQVKSTSDFLFVLVALFLKIFYWEDQPISYWVLS